MGASDHLEFICHLPMVWSLQAARSLNISVRVFADRLVGNDGPYTRAFENLILALIVISVL